MNVPANLRINILPFKLQNIDNQLVIDTAGCSSLGKITIPETVTSFGSDTRYGFKGYTFGSTTNLREINIPEGIKILPEGCFLNSGVDSLSIPATVTTLKDDCLAVSKLRYLKMGIKDITSIYYTNNIFGNVSNAALYVPKGTLDVYQEYEPWSEFGSIREYGEDTGEVFIPTQINVVIDNIKYILKDNKATIGRQSTDLAGDIVIPANISFEGNEYPVTDIISPKDLTCYSNQDISCVGGAFQNSKITSIQLPNSIFKISAGAFQGCSKLKSIILPDQLTQLGAACFAGCSALEQVNIPSSVKDLASNTAYGYRSYTFGGCRSLRQVSIPIGVTRLASGCFMNSGIEEITIHEQLLTLDNKCLYTSTLKKVTLCVKDMDELLYTNNVFGDVSNTDLFVPKGSKQVYQEYYPWIDFKSISEYDDGSTPFVPSKITTRIDYL